MKTISPIFKHKEDKGGYILILVTVLILAFCLLIAYAAFASTEAGQDAKREARCVLKAVASKHDITKTSTYRFPLSFTGHADIAKQIKRQVERALAGGYSRAYVTCEEDKAKSKIFYTYGGY
jgi:hypothetical protein